MKKIVNKNKKIIEELYINYKLENKVKSQNKKIQIKGDEKGSSIKDNQKEGSREKQGRFTNFGQGVKQIS